MVGGPEERDMSFQCDEGFLTNGEPHGIYMPNEVATWYRQGAGSLCLEPDDSISAVDEDPFTGAVRRSYMRPTAVPPPTDNAVLPCHENVSSSKAGSGMAAPVQAEPELAGTVCLNDPAWLLFHSFSVCRSLTMRMHCQDFIDYRKMRLLVVSQFGGSRAANVGFIRIWTALGWLAGLKRKLSISRPTKAI